MKPEPPKKVKAKPGFLIVASRPRSKIYVNGRYTRRSTPVRPDKPLKLSPGTHTITLKVGRKRFKFKVTIRSGEMSRLVKLLPVRKTCHH